MEFVDHKCEVTKYLLVRFAENITEVFKNISNNPGTTIILRIVLIPPKTENRIYNLRLIRKIVSSNISYLLELRQKTWVKLR